MKDEERASQPLLRQEWQQGILRGSVDDAVAVESPLQIRVNGAPTAVVMRTPGHDEYLGLGMLRSEGAIETLDDVRSVRHCDQESDEGGAHNVLQVVVADRCLPAIQRMRRTNLTGSSCGVCGRTTIEDLLAMRPSLHHHREVITPALFAGAARTLARSQPTFAATGGVHGVGLFTREGELLRLFEDVGRHNAVDKVLGWRLQHGAQRGTLLMVSGRVSFEIVQKAMMSGVPAVAAVSAPTSLAVELATACGMTLACFVREDRMCVYAGGERILSETETLD